MIKKAKVILLMLLLLSLLVIALYFTPLFSEMQKIKQIVEGAGPFAPLIYIGLQIIQVIVAPIPGQLVGFLGGYFFGVWLGTFYSIIGTAIGTMLVAAIARKFGKPVVIKLVSKKSYDKFNRFFDKKGKIFLFLIYLLPFFPDDAISAIAGLSKIKIRTITALAVVGRLPGMFGLSILGAGVAQAKAAQAVMILGILIALSFMIYLKKEKLEKTVLKIIKR